MAVDLQDPRFKLHGDPKQYPRYATHAWRNGFTDCAAIVQRGPGERIQRIMWDGSLSKAQEYTDFDAWMNDMSGRAQQISGLAVAAMLHDHAINKE